MNQPSGPTLFVSHHSSQLDVAQHVERALNAKGIRCWIAPRDVEPGASFARAIPDAISESTAVLLLFSAASVKSPHVERELILADQLGKTIIPLRIEKVVDPGGLRYHLAAAQWIDWLEQRDAAIDRIAARAREFASAAPAVAPPSTPDQAAPPPTFYPSHQPVSAAGTPMSGPGPGPGPSGGGYGDSYPPAQPYGAPPAPYGAPPPRSGSKAGLWIGLGALALVALVVLLVLIDMGSSSSTGSRTADVGGTGESGSGASSMSDPAAPVAAARRRSAATNGSGEAGEPVPVESSAAISEEWFAGVWADTRDCEEPYRFDAGGVLTTPAGDQGSWTIENGNTLVVRAGTAEERRVIRRVSDDEIATGDGPAYRCFPSTPRG